MQVTKNEIKALFIAGAVVIAGIYLHRKWTQISTDKSSSQSSVYDYACTFFSSFNLWGSTKEKSNTGSSFPDLLRSFKPDSSLKQNKSVFSTITSTMSVSKFSSGKTHSDKKAANKKVSFLGVVPYDLAKVQPPLFKNVVAPLKPEEIWRGLHNGNNLCWMNALLSLFVTNSHMDNVFFPAGEDADTILAKDTPQIALFRKALFALVCELRTPKSEVSETATESLKSKQEAFLQVASQIHNLEELSRCSFSEPKRAFSAFCELFINTADNHLLQEKHSQATFSYRRKVSTPNKDYLESIQTGLAKDTIKLKDEPNERVSFYDALASDLSVPVLRTKGEIEVEQALSRAFLDQPTEEFLLQDQQVKRDNEGGAVFGRRLEKVHFLNLPDSLNISLERQTSFMFAGFGSSYPTIMPLEFSLPLSRLPDSAGDNPQPSEYIIDESQRQSYQLESCIIYHNDWHFETYHLVRNEDRLIVGIKKVNDNRVSEISLGQDEETYSKTSWIGSLVKTFKQNTCGLDIKKMQEKGCFYVYKKVARS